MLNDHKTAYVLAAILACVVCIILACCCRIISDLFGCKARIRACWERRRRRRRLQKSGGSKGAPYGGGGGAKFDRAKLPIIITTEPSTVDHQCGELADGVAVPPTTSTAEESNSAP